MAGKKTTLKLIELRDPYTFWETPGVQENFCKAIGLRLRGYQANHFEGVLPFDAADMISTHFLLCEEVAKNDFRAVLGYRTVSLSKIEYHKQTFAPLSVAQLCNGPEHLKALNQVIDSCKSAGKELFLID